jgi:DNA-binding IclR family transcriptional regulator
VVAWRWSPWHVLRGERLFNIKNSGGSVSSDKAPAVHRAFAILEGIKRRGPLTLTEVVEETGLNKSTAYYLLQALVARQVVELDPLGRRYRLGVGLIELGSAASDGLTDIGVAKRYLAELLERLNVTIVLYQRLSPNEIILVDKMERVSRVRITLPLGTRIPIQGGSFGRAFLAYDAPAAVDEVLEHGLQAFTPRSLVDVDAFRAELAEVRERGWAVDHEGFALGVSSVAAPIFGRDGRVSLVAGAVTFAGALTDAVAAEYGAQLRASCDRVSRTIVEVDVPSRLHAHDLSATGADTNR